MGGEWPGRYALATQATLEYLGGLPKKVLVLWAVAVGRVYLADRAPNPLLSGFREQRVGVKGGREFKQVIHSAERVVVPSFLDSSSSMVE
jgi:hypothetical protein